MKVDLRKVSLGCGFLSICFVAVGLCLFYFLLEAGLDRQRTASGYVPNQQTPLTSYGGDYVLNVNSVRRDQPVDARWILTIQDAQGEIVLRHEDNPIFIGTLSVYWLWDAEDRVWLYNSDDASVYFWEQTGDGWQIFHWGQHRKREIDREVSPPVGLYPIQSK